MLRRAVYLCVLATSLLSMNESASALSPGVTGAWYNPEQSGHGITIEVLSPQNAIVFWYVYDAAGNPYNLYVEGTIIDNRIEGRAYAPRGMRFGVFDSSELEAPEWGEIRIEFSGCNSAVMHWASTLAEFGEGTTPLNRLTSIQGLGCSTASGGGALKGLYDLSLTPGRSAFPPSGIAAVDGQGRVWAADFSSTPDLSPAPGWVSGSRPCVATGTVNPPGSDTPSSLMERGNGWQATHVDLFCDDRGWQGEAVITANGFALESANADDATSWSFASRVNATLVSPLSLADLEGTRTLRLRTQFFEVASTLTVEANGDVCVDRWLGSQPETLPCGYRGRLVPDPTDPGFLDMELITSDGMVFRGRGWLEDTPSGRRLVLIGDNGQHGMGIVAK